LKKQNECVDQQSQSGKFPAWNICFQQLMILAKIFSYRKNEKDE